MKNAFGSEAYAREELVAELCSAFLCAELGFEKTITNNAAYIQNWIKLLENDSRHVFSASKNAQVACDYVLAFQHITQQ